MGVLRRVDKAPGGVGAVGPDAHDVLMEGTFPSIWEYLSTDAWPDGSARQSSTLTIFVEGGRVKVCLSDRENDRSAWASGESLEEAAMSLERALGQDTVEWRKRPQTPPPRQRK